MFQPSKVYASLLNSPNYPVTDQSECNKITLPQSRTTVAKSTSAASKEIQVTAIGELSQPPDRSRLRVHVSSVKENVQDVKNSITRRLDYIIQTLKNHGIKDNDIEIHKNLQRVESAFRFEVTVQAVFCDLQKSQSVANMLVEKLDETVIVHPLQYFHAPSTLATIRQQASMLAISNCKQKAQDMARFVHLMVGQPLRICEDEWKEWEGTGETTEPPSNSDNIPQKLQQATYNISCKVSVTFELKPKVKTKTVK